MGKVFGIFSVEIVKEDFPGEGLMDVAIIKGIPSDKNYGVYYAENLSCAAIVIESSNFVLISGVRILTKEQLAEEKVCPDFNVDILKKRLP